jgi:hypothetical protein
MEIYLDFCWSVAAYWGTNLQDSFYRTGLPFLAGLLNHHHGKILLPLHAQIFLKIIEHVKPLARYVSLELLTYERSQSLNLVIGTMAIEKEDWVTLFEKDEEPHRRQLTTTGWQSTLKAAALSTLGEGFKNRCLRVYEHLKHDQGDCFIEMKRLGEKDWNQERDDYILVNRDD